MLTDDGGHGGLIVDEILEELDKLAEDFNFLLEKKNSSRIALATFFKRILMQYGLQGEYSEFFIINEAYLRSYDYIRKGRKIKNLTPFLKKVGKNIVSELSRKSKRTCYIPEGFEIPSPEEEYEVEETIKAKLDIANIAFNRIDEFDKEIINLKIVQGLSWEEISKYLRAHGKGDFSATALRKRKERAKKKLREIYHSLENSKDNCI